MKVRVVVLASGKGSNFGVLAEAARAGSLSLEIAALVTDRPGAPCTGLACGFGVPVIVLPGQGMERPRYDRRLAEVVAGLEPDWVLLLGWMRILTMEFLGRFPGRVVNLHPALPGMFPGKDAIARAWEAGRAGRIERTGAMLHLVPDEGVDTGPVLLVEELPLLPEEELSSLEERVHALEHRLVLELGQWMCR